MEHYIPFQCFLVECCKKSLFKINNSLYYGDLKVLTSRKLLNSFVVEVSFYSKCRYSISIQLSYKKLTAFLWHIKWINSHRFSIWWSQLKTNDSIFNCMEPKCLPNKPTTIDWNKQVVFIIFCESLTRSLICESWLNSLLGIFLCTFKLLYHDWLLNKPNQFIWLKWAGLFMLLQTNGYSKFIKTFFWEKMWLHFSNKIFQGINQSWLICLQ